MGLIVVMIIAIFCYNSKAAATICNSTIYEFSIYEHAVTCSSGIRLRSEFTLAGSTLHSPPYPPGYATTYSNKLTSGRDYLSTEVGRANGILTWPSPVLAYASGVFALGDGDIVFAGYVNALSPTYTFHLSSGSGKYFGTFGVTTSSMVEINGGGYNFVVIHRIELYPYKC